MNQQADNRASTSVEKLRRVIGWLSTIPVALIVLLTFADVLGRYLFASPVKGSVEIIEFTMALVIFSALPLVTSLRGHVTVSLIDDVFKGYGRKIKLVLCDAVSASALGLLTWRLYLQGKDDLESGSATIVLGMPHAPLSFALTFYAGLSTLMMLILLWQSASAKGDSV